MWNEITKTMIDLRKITPLALNMDTDGLFIPFCGVPLMQFTGLYDKTGKPIYEGDIVEIQNLPCQIQKMRLICSVEFEWAAWVAIVKKVVVWRYYGPGVEAPDMFFFSSIIDARDYRVIGNIYENPDLSGATP
jgi:uncharacterized phage protein (TIGR01671 family)